jgi:lipopolysaccharide heptosyltransferase II
VKNPHHPAESTAPIDEWDTFHRILVVRLDNIGDVILLGPALRALKQRSPQASLTLLASPAGASVASLLPEIDDVLPYRAEWQSVGGSVPLDPTRTAHLAATLSEHRFDAAVIFTSFSQSPYPAAMACYLAGIPHRIGQSKEFGGEVLTHWVVPPDDGVHQADRNLYLLQTAGVPSIDTRLRLRVPAHARRKVDALLTANGIGAGKLVVAVPGASCGARRYDPVRFAEALRHLIAESGADVVVAGSEKERWMADLAQQRSPSVVSLAGLTSMPELAALVQRADLVVAANSASLHVADALNRPVLVLYSGAEEIEQWRPRHAPSVLLGRFAECSPCHEFECPRDMRCLNIEPAEVAEHALQMLEQAEIGVQVGRKKTPEAAETGAQLGAKTLEAAV